MAQTQDNQSTSDLRHEAELAEEIRGGRSAATPDMPIVARPVRRYRARLFQGFLIAATLSFGVLFFYARHIAYFDFDLSISRWIQQWHTFWLDVVMASVSELGFSPLAPVFVVLTMVFVYLIGLKWEMVMFVL